jgi:hypothetical protein
LGHDLSDIDDEDSDEGEEEEEEEDLHSSKGTSSSVLAYR